MKTVFGWLLTKLLFAGTLFVSAVSSTDVQAGVPGDRKFKMVELTLPNPYAAGGVPVTAALFGMTRLDAFTPACTSSPLYELWYDRANLKVGITVVATGVEAGAIDLSAIKVHGIAVGI
jgi:hypothetical protein